MRVDDLVTFIVMRHNVYLKRAAGKAKPWTEDAILRKFKFCNVYRELDTVTQWVAKHYREPLTGNPDLWFGMAVARWVNWPATLYQIGIPVPWNKKKFLKVLRDRAREGEKVWTGAYMIGTQGNAMDKSLFIAEGVLEPLWMNRNYLRPRKGDSLQDFADRVVSVKNQGKFMVGQIVADAKYEKDSILASAPDWHTFAVSGPGSRRGLNRVLERDKNRHWREEEWKIALNALQEAVNSRIPKNFPPLHAQDLQNCLCEFDKYERVRLGEGRPRSLYPGA